MISIRSSLRNFLYNKHNRFFAGEKPSYSGATVSTPTENNKSSQTYVIGGNWNFDVINGKVQNFKVNILMVPIDGSPLHIPSMSYDLFALVTTKFNKLLH